MQFIKRIARDPRKRFILTSRSTILNQGKLLNDVFQHHRMDRNEFEITLGSFSEMDRARILYNHLWHSGLAREYIDELYQGKRYRQIISHRNYNPRLIHYITDAEVLADCPPGEYWAHATELLENPSQVWEHPFVAQHDDYGRALVLLVTLNGRPIEESELAEAYARYAAQPEAANLQGRRDFLLNMRHLTGSMLSRVISETEKPRLNLFNPSIGDFVLRRYAADIPSLRCGFASLRSASSLQTLEGLRRNDIVEVPAVASILNHLVVTARDLHYVGFSSSYVGLACALVLRYVVKDAVNRELIASAIEFLLRAECAPNASSSAVVLGWGHSNGYVTDKELGAFVIEACRNSPQADECDELGMLVERLDGDLRESVVIAFNEAVTDYLMNGVSDEIDEDEVFRSLQWDDLSGAEGQLRSLIVQKLERWGVNPDEIEVSEIVRAFDIPDRMDGYFSRDMDPDDDVRISWVKGQHDEVDDLFERDY